MAFAHRLAATLLLLLIPASGQTSVDGGMEAPWRAVRGPQPMPAPEVSGFAPIRGIQMYYGIYGKGHGTPILLVHGGMGSSDVWGSEVPELARNHEVIVADSRGQGRSTRTNIPFTYHLMAEDYVALLDYLKIDKVALVGFSDGGIIGIDMAIHHPERLTKLFAQAANVSPSGLFPETIASAVNDVKASAATGDGQTASDEMPPLQQAIETMWATEPNYTTAELRSIRVPTEIVVGDHDEFIKPSHSRYMADTIPGAKLVVLSNVSHGALYQNPRQYLDAIERFIGR